jgi:hypothetical protein
VAEGAGLDEVGEVGVGGADDAYVHGPFLGAADRLGAALLDGAQELHLHRERQFGDLVEEQGAAAGCLEQAHLVLVGAGEAALPVAEELAFHQVVGMAPQFTGTQGPSLRPLERWMSLATSSLPVPVLPRM